MGVKLKYKYDRKLFRKYTCNAEEPKLTELQFADDAALLATTRDGAEEALHKDIEVAGDFSLTVSVPNTKLMVTGREATDTHRTPIPVGDEQIESVTEFSYVRT